MKEISNGPDFNTIMKSRLSLTDFEHVKLMFDDVRKLNIPLADISDIFEKYWPQLLKAGQHFCYTTLFSEPQINEIRARDTFVGALALPSGRFAVYSTDSEWYTEEGEDYDAEYDESSPDFVRYNFHGILSDAKSKPVGNGYYEYGNFEPMTMEELEFLLDTVVDIDENTINLDEQGHRITAEALLRHISFGYTHLLPEELLTKEFLEQQDLHIDALSDWEEKI